ncbi:hypothetical protein PsorP6_006081 [Peronosclerospora sorghi]|uniref:Uncharacterized protein n=1 Tax=Peronosclerospora sorghi TaxID=230839 RepID=A0ACC0W0W5_9STRA|nr:hypothetical protein PsorP6_006081 [Peronosclerospora sorghi]
MIVIFGSSNAFGRDVNETEMMVLAGTVFVVSVLLVLVYKLARGCEDLEEDDFGATVLPLHVPRATNRWVTSRKTQFGRLDTIQEYEITVQQRQYLSMILSRRPKHIPHDAVGILCNGCGADGVEEALFLPRKDKMQRTIPVN